MASRYAKSMRGGVLKVPRANVQQFEFRKDGMSNTITTVSKDYLTIGRWKSMDEVTNQATPKVEDYLYKDYGVFKLSPRECGRLMNFRDKDIDAMMSVNSNSQVYKQCGNAIVVSVLMAIFSQLHIKRCPVWNEMTEEEQYKMVYGEDYNDGLLYAGNVRFAEQKTEKIEPNPVYLNGNYEPTQAPSEEEKFERMIKGAWGEEGEKSLERYRKENEQ